MKSFRQKRRWENLAQSKPVLIILGVLVLVFAWNVLGFWNKMRETEKNKKIVEDKVAELKQQKENYSSQINDLNTDQGKEKFFRESLGLAKQGEDMIVVIDDKNAPIVQTAAPGGFFSFLFFWKNWFK